MVVVHWWVVVMVVWTSVEVWDEVVLSENPGVVWVIG